MAKEIFKLSIKISHIENALYFEDKETAEKMASFLMQILKKKYKKQMRIEASVHTLLDRVTVIDSLALAFGFSEKETNDLINNMK